MVADDRGQAILVALIASDERFEQAYRTSAVFKQGVRFLSAVLPTFLDSMAEAAEMDSLLFITASQDADLQQVRADIDEETARRLFTEGKND